MDNLQGPQITGRMIEKVVDSGGTGSMRLWLVKSHGEWMTVVAGGVDGSEEHVLTYATVLSQTIRRKEGERWRFEYDLAAIGFNSMFFKR
jgi:hypothetical protein